jgi:hypothetical protein
MTKAMASRVHDHRSVEETCLPWRNHLMVAIADPPANRTPTTELRIPRPSWVPKSDQETSKRFVWRMAVTKWRPMRKKAIAIKTTPYSLDFRAPSPWEGGSIMNRSYLVEMKNPRSLGGLSY